MSKLLYKNNTQTSQTAVLVSVNNPTSPLEQSLLSEKKFTDPSSAMPKGTCYPIPNFFEYRARPKEFDSL